MSKISDVWGVVGYHETRIPMLGVECEIESLQSLGGLGAGFWAMTEDGSLRNGGKEFISVPSATPRLEEEFKNLHATLKYGNDAFSERTSIHVHMNCQPLDEAQVRNLVLIYALFEETFFQLVEPSRRNNIHCVPLTETYLPALYNVGIRSMHRRWHKYTALNILPLSTQGTIEFRHMQGHNNPELFAQWIRILQNLYLVCQEQTLSPDLLQSDTAIRALYSRIFGHCKEYNFLLNNFDFLMSDSITDVKLAFV